MGYKSNASLLLGAALSLVIFGSVADEKKDVTEKLTEACYLDWQSKGWQIRGQNKLADNNPAFREGIRKVCQARSELYMEGYEITPFIKDDSQRDVYPLVFSSDVEAIKSHLKAFIKPLQLI